MRTLIALLLLACLALAQEFGGESEKAEADAVVIEQKVKSLLEEYEAIARNQDLVQTRRRRELAKRLGLLPHPDPVKALLRMVEPFLYHDSDVVAVGGSVCVVNGSAARQLQAGFGAIVRLRI